MFLCFIHNLWKPITRTFVIVIAVASSMQCGQWVKDHRRPLVHILSKPFAYLVLVSIFRSHFVCHFWVLSLLPQQCYSSGRNSLALGDEQAFGARTVPPAAIVFVSFEPGQSAMVTAPRALGNAMVQRTTRGRHLGKDIAHPGWDQRKSGLEGGILWT